MKNKNIFILIIFLTILFTSAYFFIMPKMYINTAKVCYNNSQYAEAAFYYSKVPNKHEIDLDNLYYYAESLSKLTPSLLVQEDLLEIIKINPNCTAAYLAQQTLDNLKRKTLKEYGSNYIDKVPYDSRILRWDLDKMPLKVYFSSENNVTVPQYYVDYIRDSFSRWQSATGDTINFTYVSEPQNADIKVIFDDSSDINKCTSDDCKYGLAYTQPKIHYNKLSGMDIVFRVKNFTNNNYTKLEIYNVALHEIGHALGIMGHSFDSNDIMYPVAIDKVYDSNVNEYKIFSSDLTYKDINTLMLLYKLRPEISNSDKGSYYNKNLIVSDIILGDESVKTTQKVDQALRYIKTAPQNTQGWVDLAAAYADGGLTQQAIKALDEAGKWAATQDERFNVYYNYAAIFVNDKEYNNAITYAQYALSIYPDNADAKTIIGYANIMLNRYDEAERTLSEVISLDPTNIDASCNLAIVYFRKFNLIKGGKVLNALVQNNPEAANDPRVKRNKLLMTIFK